MLLLTAICLSVASCASPVPREIGELEQKAVCCESLDQMKFVPLQPDRDTPVKLDHTSPVYAFESGKSYFAAFRLPSNLEGTDLEVKTYSSSVGLNDSSAFYPYFLLLDSQHQIRRTLPAPGFRFNTVDTLRGHWSIRLSFQTGDAYLVIYTSPAVFDRGLITPGSGAYLGVIGSMPYFSPGSPGGYVALGPTGNLVLRWLKREPIRSTAGEPGKPTASHHPGMVTLTGSALERGVFDWDGFQVVAVDGKRVDYGSTGNPLKMPIELTPGEHQVLVFFGTSKGYAMRWKPDAYLRVSAKFEAGHWYRVVGSIDNTLVTAWAEDAQTGKRASEQVTGSTYWETPFVDPDPPSK
jgi:maltose operon protein